MLSYARRYYDELTGVYVMKNMKISAKLAVCFLIVIMLAFASTIVSLLSMNDMANDTLSNEYTITDPLDNMVRFSIGNKSYPYP